MKYKVFLRGVGSSFLSILILLSLTHCQNDKRKMVEDAPEITTTLQDDQGKDIRLPNVAQRVVSLAPNITEMVFAIGGESKLVARSAYCDYPEKAKKLPEISTYPALDIETITSLKPDLVLLTDEIFGAETVVALEQQNLKAYTQSYRNLADIYQNIQKMGRILECSERAEKMVDSLQKVEKKIWAKTQDLAKYKTVILVSTDPLEVVGGTGYLNELITRAGGKNPFSNKTEAYPTISIEELLAQNPEFLIFPTEDKQIYPQLVVQYPGFSYTEAARKHQVFNANPDLLLRPGTRTISGLMEITQMLHAAVTPASLDN